MPDFLRDGPDGIREDTDDLVLQPYQDHDNKGRSLSLDYANGHLPAALVDFITALGKRYDGAPRIGFLQLGLLGFWGAWHPFAHAGDATSDGSPSAEVPEQILAAYDMAFNRTILHAREPKAAFS